MKDAIQHPHFPLEATPDEVRAGFELMALCGLAGPEFPDQWIQVLGKVLGSSDVLVKSAGFSAPFVYSHKRFGAVFKLRKSGPEWHQMGNEHHDIDQAIFEINIGATEEDGPIVTPVPAEIKRPEQGEAPNRR